MLSGLSSLLFSSNKKETISEQLERLRTDIDLTEPLLYYAKRDEERKLKSITKLLKEIEIIMNIIKHNASSLGSLSKQSFYVTRHLDTKKKLDQLIDFNSKFCKLTKNFVQYATMLRFESGETESLIKAFNKEVSNLKSELIPIDERVTFLAKIGDLDHLGIPQDRYNILSRIIKQIEWYENAFDQLSSLKPEPSNIRRP